MKSYSTHHVLKRKYPLTAANKHGNETSTSSKCVSSFPGYIDFWVALEKTTPTTDLLKYLYSGKSSDAYTQLYVLLLMAEILHHLGCMKPYK